MSATISKSFLVLFVLAALAILTILPRQAKISIPDTSSVETGWE